MSEQHIHYGSDTDLRHCAECGIELIDTTATAKSTMNYEIPETKLWVGKITGSTNTILDWPPKYAGHWNIGGNWHMNVTKRPRWLTRILMRFLLEWYWHDD